MKRARAGLTHATRIARAFAATAAAWLVLTIPAAAETVSSDRESRATDGGGKVLFRLMNRQSFAFPAEDLPFLRERPGWPDEASADPDQPVGRPLHPITSQSLVVRYDPVTPRHPAEPPVRRWQRQLPLLITNPDGNGPHLIQEGHLQILDRVCIDKPADDPRQNPLVDVSPALRRAGSSNPARRTARAPNARLTSVKVTLTRFQNRNEIRDLSKTTRVSLRGVFGSQAALTSLNVTIIS